MAITTVLFDLDGTLLPMDWNKFAKAYFKGLATKAAPLGYEPEKLIDSIWRGTNAMVANTGKFTNEQVFWDEFANIYGEQARADEATFDDFYHNEFQDLYPTCDYTPRSDALIKKLRGRGLNVVLATNPIFPAIATYTRARWAGLDPDDFMLITTYENSHYAKPNPDYYREILAKLQLSPAECLMIGNDATEDMIAQTLGIPVFLHTNCLENYQNVDITPYPQGGFDEMEAFIEAHLSRQ